MRFWWICLSAVHIGTETAFETRIDTLQLETRFFDILCLLNVVIATAALPTCDFIFVLTFLLA